MVHCKLELAPTMKNWANPKVRRPCQLSFGAIKSYYLSIDPINFDHFVTCLRGSVKTSGFW